MSQITAKEPATLSKLLACRQLNTHKAYSEIGSRTVKTIRGKVGSIEAMVDVIVQIQRIGNPAARKLRE